MIFIFGNIFQPIVKNVKSYQLMNWHHVVMFQGQLFYVFLNVLGLKGYAELKVYLRIDNQNYQYKQTGVELVYERYQAYIKDIKKRDMTRVIEMIANAKNTYAYGTGSIQNNVAAELKRSFLIVNKMFFTIQSTNETNAFEEIITDQDLIVIISYSGENEQAVQFAKKIKDEGCSYY